MYKASFALLAFAAMCGVSCKPQGPEVPLETTGASLEGSVQYDGHPVPMAIVIVTPLAGGDGVTGYVDEMGNYKVENVPIGEVKIGVNTDAAKGRMMGQAMAGTDPKAKGGKKMAPPKVIDIPKKYHDPEKSGLTATTREGVTKHDIKISK